jgi:hypothetical protein
MIIFHTLAGEFPVEEGDTLLLIDPRGLDAPSGDGEVVIARNRWELRQVIETCVRHRDHQDVPLLVHAQVPSVRTRSDLPWDVTAFPSIVFNPTLPDGLAQGLLSLPVPVARILAGSGNLTERLAAVARLLTGRPWPPSVEDAMASVLKIVPAATLALRQALISSCPSGTARDILESDDPAAAITALQLSRTGAANFNYARQELDELIDAGYITPTSEVSRLGNVSAWEERLKEILTSSSQAQGFQDWASTAWAWAAVRTTLAQAELSDPGLAEADRISWDAWELLDRNWVQWLRTSYGRELTKTSLTGVHGVAGFLAEEAARSGARILLLVLDGLAMSQWIQISAAAGLRPLSEDAIMAALPTITSVSRQAILSGSLPLRFANTIDRTDTEAKAWRRYWLEESGFDGDQAWYYRTDGRTSADWVAPPPDAVASAVVVNAIDNMMHGAGVNGDHQLSASVRIWTAGGFLAAAVDWAVKSGTHMWVTSDHGNIPAHGLEVSVPSDGITSTRGQRSRRFSSEGAREQSQLPGLRWTPPGYPASAGAVLFASGRDCYQHLGIAVTHGGLSVDEVIVPFVRLA